MSKNYKIFAIKTSKRPTKKIGRITESRIEYNENHSERMNPNLEKQLREKKHSLGNHPAFPEDDVNNFGEKLMSKRFNDVLKSFKRHHGVEIIDVPAFLAKQKELIIKIIELEKKHKGKLEQLAIQLVREEFNVEEADVEIIARLTTDLTKSESSKNLKINPITDIEFDNHNEFSNANKEVYKRRMVNALIQGAAKKTNHMFNLIDAEIEDLEPLLPNLYSKLISGADYMYMVEDDTKPRIVGGLVRVEFPKVEGQRPKIIAEAITLPVLIHEIVKGIMEILSYHGLPSESKIAQFVIDKADFMGAESWDMRLGPPIWEKFIESIPVDDYPLKHYVYVELVKLPVDEFNDTLREILMGTRTGKAKIADFISEIKDDLKNDEFDNVMEKLTDDDFLGPEDLDNLNDEDWFI